MRIAVVYTSGRRGNTAKVAKAIADVFGVEAQRPAEIERLDPIDLLFVGSGVYFSMMGRDLEQFLRALPVGLVKKAAVFCTYQHINMGAIHHITEMLRYRDVEVVDHFCCHGRFFFLQYRHPDGHDLDNARRFAIKVADSIQ